MNLDLDLIVKMGAGVIATLTGGFGIIQGGLKVRKIAKEWTDKLAKASANTSANSHEIVELRQEITELKSYISNLTGYVKNLEGDVERADKRAADAELRVRELERQNKEQEIKLGEYEKSLETTLQKLQDVEAQNSEILAGVDNVMSEVDKLRTDLGTDSGKLAGVDQAVANLKSKAKKKTTGPIRLPGTH